MEDKDTTRAVVDIGSAVFIIALSIVIGNWVCGLLGWGVIDGTFLLTVCTIIVVGALFAVIFMIAVVLLFALIYALVS